MALANGKPPSKGNGSCANGNGSCVENNIHRDIESSCNGVGFTNLPYREPIDIQFKDITYTVDLGFNKGMYRLQIHQLLFLKMALICLLFITLGDLITKYNRTENYHFFYFKRSICRMLINKQKTESERKKLIKP